MTGHFNFEPYHIADGYIKNVIATETWGRCLMNNKKKDTSFLISFIGFLRFKV